MLRRRVPLYRDARDQGLAAAEDVATILGRELGWAPARRERSLVDYRAAVERSRRWRAELARYRIVITPSTARSRAKRSSTASALCARNVQPVTDVLAVRRRLSVVRVLPQRLPEPDRGRGQQRCLDRVVRCAR